MFTLGATSLAALTVAARLSDAFGREMPPGAIVDRPTPREQAQWFEEVERYLSRQDRDHVIHCRPEPRQTLFAFPPLLGYGLAFHALAPHLTTHALHAFDFPENADPVETLAAAVLDAAPMGPYTFVGYSAGGNLAFDVAVALERRGAAIAAIVMLDSERREQVHPLADADIEDIVWGNIENLAGLMRESEQFRDFTRNEFLVQRMAAKMRAYLQYESVTANTGRTAADIHFIYSDDRSACTSWRDATTGAFTLRRGSGGHLEMTIGEHAERNARILGKILGNEPRGAVPE